MMTIFISQDPWQVVEGTYLEPHLANVSSEWTETQQNQYKRIISDKNIIQNDQS